MNKRLESLLDVLVEVIKFLAVIVAGSAAAVVIGGGLLKLAESLG